MEKKFDKYGVEIGLTQGEYLKLVQKANSFKKLYPKAVITYIGYSAKFDHVTINFVTKVKDGRVIRTMLARFLSGYNETGHVLVDHVSVEEVLDVKAIMEKLGADKVYPKLYPRSRNSYGVALRINGKRTNRCVDSLKEFML